MLERASAMLGRIFRGELGETERFEARSEAVELEIDGLHRLLTGRVSGRTKPQGSSPLRSGTHWNTSAKPHTVS